MNLGLLYAKENQLDKAEAELRTALSIDPSFAPGAVNLADLYRAQNRDDQGERVLKDALSRSPDDPSLTEALGLLMVRQKHGAQALELLGNAARGEPDNAPYAYVYAIALNDAGKTREAIVTLQSSIKAHPYDRDSLAALVNFLEQSGDLAKALIYANRLDELEPNDPEIRKMLKQLHEHSHG
jgi:Flp pilus assembly protein TadD